MIMRNDRKENENDDHRRIFTRILKAVKPYLNIFDCDYENHTARGLLETRGAAHIAVLAYEPSKKTFAIVIFLHVNTDWTMPRVMILLRLQNHIAVGSSSINLDTESSTLQVKSHAVLPTPSPDIVNAVITQALRDALAVLENKDFKELVR